MKKEKGKEGSIESEKTGRPSQSGGEMLSRSAAKILSNRIGKQIILGILGIIFSKKK